MLPYLHSLVLPTALLAASVIWTGIFAQRIDLNIQLKSATFTITFDDATSDESQTQLIEQSLTRLDNVLLVYQKRPMGTRFRQYHQPGRNIGQSSVPQPFPSATVVKHEPCLFRPEHINHRNIKVGSLNQARLKSFRIKNQ